MVEDAIGKVLHDFADQEGDACPEIPESVDTEVARPVPVEEFADAGPRESPEVACRVRRTHTAHRGCRGKEYAVGPQGSEAVLDTLPGSTQKVQRLGEDDAVVCVSRQRAGLLEVRDERRARVRSIDVDNDALGNSIGPERRCVGAVLYLEHRPTDHVAMLAQEGFDITPVHWRASIEAVVITKRLERQVSERGHSPSLAGDASRTTIQPHPARPIDGTAPRPTELPARGRCPSDHQYKNAEARDRQIRRGSPTRLVLLQPCSDLGLVLSEDEQRTVAEREEAACFWVLVSDQLNSEAARPERLSHQLRIEQ
jgi:hypothetical protein